MRGWAFVLILCASTAVASAQVGEFSVSGGVSRFGSASLGNSSGAAVDLHDGFHLVLHRLERSRGVRPLKVEHDR